LTGPRLDLFKLAIEQNGLAVDLEVVEAFLGRGLSWRRLRSLVGVDVEPEYPPMPVEKILDEEFLVTSSRWTWWGRIAALPSIRHRLRKASWRAAGLSVRIELQCNVMK
jgi:hypothetical protein